MSEAMGDKSSLVRFHCRETLSALAPQKWDCCCLAPARFETLVVVSLALKKKLILLIFFGSNGVLMKLMFCC